MIYKSDEAHLNILLLENITAVPTKGSKKENCFKQKKNTKLEKG